MAFKPMFPSIFEAFSGNIERYVEYLENVLPEYQDDGDPEYWAVIEELGRCRIYVELDGGKAWKRG